MSRVSFSDAGAAVRAAQARMVAADERWTASDWAVFSAAMVLVGSWSRLHDAVTRPQLAEAAGVTERQVSRSMGRLAAAGVLGWAPGRNGRTSHLCLTGQQDCTCPAGTLTQRDNSCPATSPPSGTTAVPLASKVAGQERTPSGTETATQQDSPGLSPEKTPEKTPEEGGDDRSRTDRVRDLIDPTAPRPFGEFVERLLRFVDREGHDRADQALTHLEQTGRRLGWPRDLTRALDRWATDHPAPDTTDPEPARPTATEWCRDHGADPTDELIGDLLDDLIARGQVLPDPMAVAS